MRFNIRLRIILCCFLSVLFLLPGRADEGGDFDFSRWYTILHKVQNMALEQNVSAKTINAVIQESSFYPDVVRRDKNQAEFTLTMARYLENAVNPGRVKNGRAQAKKYPTLLRQIEKKYGVPKSVIMAFWGMESDYGAFKSQHQLSDSFLTLIYDGRREQFFTTQLLALMQFADKNKLNIRSIEGSWAGAMGHFQFIPTTLAQYGASGTGKGKIDIINSVGDAMASAGNYLKRLGWDKGERIVRQVKLPTDFDMALCDGKTKYGLGEWRKMGVIGVPEASKVAGLVCDASVYPKAWLTYDNFYRVKRWNNSNFYAVAVALLAEKIGNY